MMSTDACDVFCTDVLHEDNNLFGHFEYVWLLERLKQKQQERAQNMIELAMLCANLDKELCVGVLSLLRDTRNRAFQLGYRWVLTSPLVRPGILGRFMYHM